MTSQHNERLRRIKGLVFDMDGTLILGDKKNNNMNILPGAAEFISLLIKKNIPYVVMTNGTARSPKDYVKVLSEVGIPMNDNTMMTPSSVAAEYFVQKGYKRIMVLGCPGVWEPLVDLGLDVVLSSIEDPGPVDAVFIGWYREFGFKDIENAWLAVRDGAELYTASDVPFFATANGPGIGTSCALAAALKPLTGKEAIVLGKPSSIAIESAARHLGIPVNEIAVVGDDPDLEVPMAINNGALSIYVHTGTGGPNAFDERDKSTWPHISIANVGELVALYQDDK
ncbi:MAG: HAD hydrolase-like protein [Gammaproteobacteria bacterium]|nr:HAD hydrolase-like protein [Gammaproteobacteria bacterium]